MSFYTDITHLLQQNKSTKTQKRSLNMVSSNNQDHHMDEVEEDEEIDTWIRENNKMPSVTLLKP